MVLLTIVTQSFSFIFPDQFKAIKNNSPNISDEDLVAKILDNKFNMTELLLANISDAEFLNEIGDDSISGPFCGDGEEWCTFPRLNYPARTITKAFAQQGTTLKSMFTKNILSQPIARSGGFELQETDNVCTSMSRDIRPRAAKNKNGEWMFLVNGFETNTEEGELVQLVATSTCLGHGASCGHGLLFSGQVTECRQQYSDHKLVALSGEGKELVVDTFQFPSCCTCHLHTSLES